MNSVASSSLKMRYLIWLSLLVCASFAHSRSGQHVGMNLPEVEPKAKAWSESVTGSPVLEKRASPYLNAKSKSTFNLSRRLNFSDHVQNLWSMAPPSPMSTSTLVSHMLASSQSQAMEAKQGNFTSGSFPPKTLLLKTRSPSG